MGLTANGDVVRLRVFVASALLLIALPTMVAAGTPLQVTRSDAQVLRVETGDLEPSWRATADGAYFDLRLPGLATGGLLGALDQLDRRVRRIAIIEDSPTRQGSSGASGKTSQIRTSSL